jgi:DNA recombination protein RmuC
MVGSRCPEQTLMHDASIAVICLLIGLVVGVALAWWLHRSQLEPIGNIAHRLEDALRIPQAAGAFGQQRLEAMLDMALPPGLWKRQHTFRSGACVDVVIQLPDGVIPVDAKFPIDGYEALRAATSAAERTRRRNVWVREIRRYVDEIAEKYIRLDERTLDFALCSLPSENLLHELLRKETTGDRPDMLTYALEKRVLLVSPSTLFAHLTVINLGLRGLRLDPGSRHVATAVAKLEHDLRMLQSGYTALFGHLRKAFDTSAEVARLMDRLPGQLTREIDALPLDRDPPQRAEP